MVEDVVKSALGEAMIAFNVRGNEKVLNQNRKRGKYTSSKSDRLEKS